MQAKIQEYLHEVASATPSNAQEAEALRLRFLGRKGVMNDLFADFKTVAPEARKEVGQLLNQRKTQSQHSRRGRHAPGLGCASWQPPSG